MTQAVHQAFHLAQINIGRLKFAMGSPGLAEFEAQLDPVNAIADEAPGFVWRYKQFEHPDDPAAFDDPLMLTNMSLWTDLASLGAYVFRTDHRAVMARRREWFETPTEAIMALWWVRAGEIPTLACGLQRLDHLRVHGPTAHAFTFREPFAPAMDLDPEAPVLDQCG